MNLEFLQNVWVVRAIESVLTVIGAAVIYKIVGGILSRAVDKGRLKGNKSGKTYGRMLKSIVRYIVIAVVILMLLQINGVDISSMLAAAGISGIVIGFAIQDSLKDMIRGFHIIADGYYKVGDVISYGDVVGKVLIVGMRTTRMQDVNTLNVVSIANRNVEEVEVVSNMINIDVPMPYELKNAEAERILSEIVKELKAQAQIENSEYRGVSEFGDSAVMYRLKVYCAPEEKVQVRRDALGVIMRGLERNGVAIPYMQIDVHAK